MLLTALTPPLLLQGAARAAAEAKGCRKHNPAEAKRDRARHFAALPLYPPDSPCAGGWI
jgi:hypothetical protein